MPIPPVPSLGSVADHAVSDDHRRARDKVHELLEDVLREQVRRLGSVPAGKDRVPVYCVPRHSQWTRGSRRSC